jgi:hypothetical protein
VATPATLLGVETKERAASCDFDFSRCICPASSALLKTPASRSPCTITWSTTKSYTVIHLNPSTDN